MLNNDKYKFIFLIDDKDEYTNGRDNDEPMKGRKGAKKKIPDDPLMTDSSPEKKDPKVENKLQKFEKWIQVVNDQVL